MNNEIRPIEFYSSCIDVFIVIFKTILAFRSLVSQRSWHNANKYKIMFSDKLYGAGTYARERRRSNDNLCENVIIKAGNAKI